MPDNFRFLSNVFFSKLGLSILILSIYFSNSSLITVSIGKSGFQLVPPIFTCVVLNLPKFCSNTSLSTANL